MKRQNEPRRSRATGKQQTDKDRKNAENMEERGQRENDKAKKTCKMDGGMEKEMTETRKEK